MKKGWTYKKLGELCDILDSQRKPITKDKRESGNIPYYGATGCLDYVKDYIFDEKLVLLGEDGAKWGAGEDTAYIITGKSWVNNHAHALRPKREIVIDELLVYYLNYANLQSFITGVTVPKLNQEKMRSILIPLAPLSEQKAIVSRLDSAFAKIDAWKANAKKQLDDAKALFQKALEKAMEPKEGWEEKKLGEICEKSQNINWKNIAEGMQYTYIDLTSVDRNSLSIIAPQFIDKTNAPSRAKQIIKKGDIIFATTRPTLRRLCLVSSSFDSQICSTGFCVLRPKQEIASKWIYYTLQYDKFYQYIEPLQTGASYPAVTDGIVKEFNIYFPSLSEQQAIVTRLDSLSENVKKLQEVLDKTIKECDALKQAMLRQVFE